MKKAILVAIVLIGVGIVACKKDNNGPKTNPKIDLITSATWKIDTIGFDMDKNGSIDTEVPGGFNACETDNTLKFSSDSTGVYDEGATKCDPADPQSIPFTWTYNDTSSVINIQGALPGELKGDIKVLTLTETSFIMSKNIVQTFPVQFDGNLIVSLVK
jgi:hypothetical protein